LARSSSHRFPLQQWPHQNVLARARDRVHRAPSFDRSTGWRNAMDVGATLARLAELRD